MPPNRVLNKTKRTPDKMQVNQNSIKIFPHKQRFEIWDLKFEITFQFGFRVSVC